MNEEIKKIVDNLEKTPIFRSQSQYRKISESNQREMKQCDFCGRFFIPNSRSKTHTNITQEVQIHHFCNNKHLLNWIIVKRECPKNIEFDSVRQHIVQEIQLKEVVKSKCE